ncbi:branched-chain amino acid ABC transporter permease [Oscillibacter sp.]|uniref:branched-chain amino acid ABC transporter permease n=1 Tax=Oscillibacter sp. TaxID=1945593 RepID=UPI0028994586|nr:branched-chain amino acid ABC transporter permease [Oscillibacter sp.]
MYINAETLNDLARLLGSLIMIGSAVLAVYKFIERDRTQSKTIRAIQTEQTLLCYGIKACLQGLAEQGCNGPVHDALDKLEKHLNKQAHGDILDK